MEMSGDNSIRITEKDLPQRFNVKYLGKCEAKGLWGIKHTRTPVDVMVSFAKDRQLTLPIVQLKVSKEGILMAPLKCKPELKPDMRKMEENKDLKLKCKSCKTAEKPKDLFINFQQAFFKNKKVLKDSNDNLVNKNISGDFMNPEERVKLEEKFKSKEKSITFFGVDTISYGVQDLIYTRVFSMIVVNEQNNMDYTQKSPFTCHAFVCDSRHTARKLTYSLAAAFLVYSQSVKLIKQQCTRNLSYRATRPRLAAFDLRTPEQIQNEMRSLQLHDSEA